MSMGITPNDLGVPPVVTDETQESHEAVDGASPMPATDPNGPPGQLEDGLETVVDDAGQMMAPPMAPEAEAGPEAEAAPEAAEEAPDPYDGDRDYDPDPDFEPRNLWGDATGGLVDYAYNKFADYGWGPQEMHALIGLWNETASGMTQSHVGTARWDPEAMNPVNGASGIPGLLPDVVENLGDPMRWDDPQHQVDVGLEYIKGKYKTPTQAWNHMRHFNWY